MYESFYRLQTNPFSLAPDPHFCFSHAGHKQAREYLEYALQLGEGMVMVTGSPGTGKTTLVESFLDNLNTGSVMAARIAVSRLNSKDLLRAVAYAFDIKAEGHDVATLRHLIKQYLETLAQRGRRALLIIDEAQGLPHSALDELRLLADLQADSQQMLQLFLVGQEQLHEQMLDPEMDYFQQRVIANYRLVPLDLQETRSYIEYRLRQAGWQGAPEFTGAAVLDIFRFSRGVPRHINKLCNRLLLLGYAIGCQTLDREQVQAIIEEMGAERLSPIAAQRSTQEADAEILDEQALQQDLLSELAIRIEESLEPATVNTIPNTDQLTGEHVDESLETDDFPTLAALHEAAPTGAVPLGPEHIYSKKILTMSNWQKILAPSLVIATVALLTFVAITNLVDNNIGQRLAAIMGESEQPYAAQRQSDQQTGLTVAVVAELERSITDAEYDLLQRVLNDELPATALGSLLSDVATSTDGQSDSPLGEVLNFVSQAEYIDYLLEQGQQALGENRLLTPALNSAYYYFQSALRLAPETTDAAQGIKHIVERYVVLTNKALEQQDGMMANRYIARGLSIQPGNSELLALKGKSSPTAIDQGEEHNRPSPQSISQLLSRVKRFFINASTSQQDTQANYQLTSSLLYE